MNLESYLTKLEEVVNIDSGSTDVEGCLRIVNYFKKEFEDMGLGITIHQAPGENPYIEARYTGRNNSDEIDIMIMGHLDTVFAKGTVAERPFSKDETKCYGPGVADMKDGALLAVEILRTLVKEKSLLNICVVFNTDEETGSKSSEAWIKEIGAKSKYSFNFEPARADGSFVKERKGVYDYYIDFKGIASHAGVAPEKGASAINEMARWIVELETLANPALGTTLNAGIVKGGTASNVVAPSASIVIDLRYTKEEERERIETSFDAMSKNPFVARVGVKWRRGDGFPPMTEGDKLNDTIEIMNSVAKERNLPTPTFVSTGGGSDSNSLGGLVVTCIDGCGPVGDDYHSEKEYMVIDTILERYELMLGTIKEIEKTIK